jgi:hypothetical protein
MFTFTHSFDSSEPMRSRPMHRRVQANNSEHDDDDYLVVETHYALNFDFQYNGDMTQSKTISGAPYANQE